MKVFVDIACLESYGEQAIDMIAVELLAALEAGASINRVALVQNVLSKWRRFWSGMSQGLLSKEQQLGLFGELWFLARWLAPVVGFPKATAIWRGPLGARNDFESPTITVEVKTTSRLDRTCKINGIEQLMAPANGSLFLFGLEVREEGGATDTMPALIDEIRAGMAEDYESLSRFDTCLYAADYLDDLAREYGKLKLRVKREELFEVAGDFPRVTPHSLRQGMPPGISGVTYELSLDAAASWRIASGSSQAVDLIRTRLV